MGTMNRPVSQYVVCSLVQPNTQPVNACVGLESTNKVDGISKVSNNSRPMT